MRQKTWSEMAIKKIGLYKVSKTTLKAIWIDISDATTDNGGYDWHIRDLACSNCKNWIKAYHGPKYCDNCGARMIKTRKGPMKKILKDGAE